MWGLILRVLGEAFVHYFVIRRWGFLVVGHPWNWVEGRPVRVKVLCTGWVRSFAQSMNEPVYKVNVGNAMGSNTSSLCLDLFPLAYLRPVPRRVEVGQATWI